jgi:hypothetical protein
VAVTEATRVAERLLDAVAVRDYEAVGGCFAEDASFDVLTPHRLRRHSSAAEAAERYRRWLEPLEQFEVLEADATSVADRVRVRYRFRGLDPDKGWQLNEHTGYAAIEAGRIASMTLTCAGFRPTAAP